MVLGGSGSSYDTGSVIGSVTGSDGSIGSDISGSSSVTITTSAGAGGGGGTNFLALTELILKQCTLSSTTQELTTESLVVKSMRRLPAICVGVSVGYQEGG